MKRSTEGTLFRYAHVYLALLIPTAVFAFWKTYYGILSDLPEFITPVFHIHAFLMMLWLLMLVTQAWFIRTRRFRWHRWLGRTSYVIAPLIILAGLATIHAMFNRTPELPFVLARLNVLGFGQLIAFAITWGFAMAYRKQTALHVRFMVSTVFAMATAVVFRIFLLWIPRFDTPEKALVGNCAVLTLLLLGAIAVDWSRGIKRSPFWVVTVVLSIMHAGYWTFANTSGWYAFCVWYAGL